MVTAYLQHVMLLVDHLLDHVSLLTGRRFVFRLTEEETLSCATAINTNHDIIIPEKNHKKIEVKRIRPAKRKHNIEIRIKNVNLNREKRKNIKQTATKKSSKLNQ